MIGTAESPLGQAVATVAAWLMLGLAALSMFTVALVPGKQAVDLIVPFFVVLFFVSIGSLLNWIGTAADRSEDDRTVRLIAYRVVAGIFLIYPLLSMASLALASQ
jgi:hypothetical protein